MEIHALGARSFTIWNSTFTPIFDSGDQLEQITSIQNAAAFNSDGTSSSFDGRSDNKGPEPEGVTTGMVNGVLYAFVGSERTGDIFLYDITNPAAPVFKQYINTVADRGVEGIIFVSASDSPTGNALVIVSAEVSRTISVYEFAPPTVNLSVSANTASETAGTVVTITATSLAPVDGNKTLSLNVSGTDITSSDYNLSNTTITILSGATSGSVTFTVINDNTVESVETAVLTISNPSPGIALGATTTQNIAIDDFVFTLQVLHASDFEAAVDAVVDAPRFAAIVDQLEDSYSNTIKLTSGDNYIPGPFLSSGEDSSLAAAFKTAYESYYNTTFTNPPANLLPSIGRADISIMNFIGFEASALGNHEFDLGTNEIRNIIRGANNSSGTTTTWFGAQFPYLSSNLNFSGDGNLSAIATTDRLRLNTSFQSNPSESRSVITNKLKLAPSTIIMKGGQKIGVVGATTQVLASISALGATTVIGGGSNDMNVLAGIVQPVVNSLIADGCNKIILLSHLQQIAFEKELATKLTGVDIIMAGGSNTLLADANDRLRAGDVAVETYPFLATDLDGKTIALINTDGNYQYVGRLVVGFDSDGTLIPSSIDPLISGVYAADEQGLNDVWGANVGNAFAVGTRGYQVQLLCNAIGNVITVKDGNLFGKTSVFLEGRRNFVRTEETNLGNVTAEANLWMANFYDSTTVISIKNGGGIRSAIGNVIAVGDDVTLVPPIANPSAGKQSGDISQLDIENSLRFNNQLSLVTLTASGLRSILEHAVAGTTATSTPGQFAQVAGVRYSYNFSNPVGSRILNAVITDPSGNITDTLVLNGATTGNLSRTFRVVTLNFLAGGGDGYPFNTLGTNRVDLNTLSQQGPAMASFTNAGSEQDAFAEFMKSQYNTTPYGIAETPLVQDCRIQRVPARTDDVLTLNPGTNGALVIANGTTVTDSQLFAALGGTPAIGGTWSPALASVGVYTYTVTSSCAGSASATVKVTDFICTYGQGAWGNIGGSFCNGTIGGLSNTQLITQSLTNAGGTITLGRLGRSVVISSPAGVQCTIDKLPGGGSPRELSIGNTSICSLPNGKIKNGLLSQAITLALNVNMTSPSFLGSFKLQAGTFATAKPVGGCGSNSPSVRVCGYYNSSVGWIKTINEYSYTTINSSVINAIIADENGDKTVAGLLDLANRALGNSDNIIGSESGVGLLVIQNAVESIINAFDNCRVFIGWNITPCSSANARTADKSVSNTINDVFSVIVYPNPFAGAFMLDVISSTKENINIKVYDMVGRLIEQRDTTVSDLENLTIGNGYPSGVYNVNVTQGTQMKTLRVVKR